MFIINLKKSYLVLYLCILFSKIIILVQVVKWVLLCFIFYSWALRFRVIFHCSFLSYRKVIKYILLRLFHNGIPFLLKGNEAIESILKRGFYYSNNLGWRNVFSFICFWIVHMKFIHINSPETDLFFLGHLCQE